MLNPIPHRIHSFQAADSRGKHRIQAELKRLEQEARFLEPRISCNSMKSCILHVEFEGEKHQCSHRFKKEELEQMERMEKASAACKEMLSNVESKPDPLLPITKAPINPLWDQWFEGSQEAQGCKCWIL